MGSSPWPNSLNDTSVIHCVKKDMCEQETGPLILIRLRWIVSSLYLMIDAANDVYASLLIYDKLMAMGKEREIEIVRRGMCSDHGNFKDFIPPLVSSNGQVVPHIAGRDGSKSPTAAQSRTIAMFIEGKNTNEIASEMGVKQATAQ
jgi:hypothetical protein